MTQNDRNQYSKEWYKQNKKHKAEYARLYRQTHKSIIDARTTQWMKDNKEYVALKARQKNKLRKEALMKEYGGKCIICGYNKCSRALHFHHRNPKEKTGSVSTLLNRSCIEEAREEAKKCILICSNCHMELHDGMINLSNN